MLLLRWFSTHFARTVANSFSDLHECLSIAMDESFILDGGNQCLNIASRHKRLLDDLLAESVQLDLAYSIAAFELRLGRISGRDICASITRDVLNIFIVESIKPLIAVVENTRRELSWGSLRVKTLREKKLCYARMKPAVDLGQAILVSMKHVEATLLYVFEHSAGTLGPKPSDKDTSTQILHQLDRARDSAREVFAGLHRYMNEDTKRNENVEIPPDVSDQFLFLVSLIEVCPSLYLSKNTRQCKYWLLRWPMKCAGPCVSLIASFTSIIPLKLAYGTHAFPWHG